MEKQKVLIIGAGHTGSLTAQHIMEMASKQGFEITQTQADYMADFCNNQQYISKQESVNLKDLLTIDMRIPKIEWDDKPKKPIDAIGKKRKW